MVDEQNPVVAGQVVYDSPNTANLEDYLRLDASAIYGVQLGKSKLQIAASVWNLLNKENIINSFYDLNFEQSGVQLNNQRSLGITPNVALRYYF
jgi:hypothetical protein